MTRIMTGAIVPAAMALQSYGQVLLDQNFVTDTASTTLPANTTVKIRDLDVTAGCTNGQLDPAKSVTVGVKTIPGLTYRLVRKGEVGAAAEVGADEKKADAVRTKLEDRREDRPKGQAFYLIRIVK